MCGIIGAVTSKDVVSTLIEGLKRLEYRGYDSAGIAVIDSNNHLQSMRTLGKVRILENNLRSRHLTGHCGIAHTRWATHGLPSERNAHPHIAGNKIAIVHNGIIENYLGLREDLIAQGCKFGSETDSEVIAHLIYLKIQSGLDFLSAFRNTTRELQGSFALAVINSMEPGRILAARHGSSLSIGLGKNGNYVASDKLALSLVTKQIIYLEEEDVADITADKVVIYDQNNQEVQRKIITLNEQDELMDKGPFKHFMQKEIFEQPRTATAMLEGRITKDKVLTEAFGAKAAEIFKKIQHVEIVGCGTSYHAAVIGKYWLEEIAGISCQVEIASENRYRKKVVEENTLFVALSQSGETIDTLAALRLAKMNHYAATLAICNSPHSTITRESDLVLMTNAGPEIGVASTKSFVAQLIALSLLTLALSNYRQTDINKPALLKDIALLPQLIKDTLELDPFIKKIAHDFLDKEHALFIGRGLEFPIAMEGALKLKEISYIHAEAYASGELKHGSIALIDTQMPVIALAPDDELLEKLKSNLEEVLARGGNLYVFANMHSKIEAKANTKIIYMPAVNKYLAPIIYVIPLQLLAYHVAALMGRDIDQPRNLAKSVTVE